ncbi:serpin B4-like [Ixodes scapularis]|uniref:serpin B4-like n=1 Tax=Ixodes scapularis TaxID=6945 RepID=UPI001A9FF5A4|nr:serpin B4-like [Ixodes scapularis]
MGDPASEALTKFGLALFKEVIASSDSTVALCPAAAASSLATATACAKGETASQLTSALGSAKGADLQTAVLKLQLAFSKPVAGAEVSLVHRAFTDKGVHLDENFVKSLESRFRCGVTRTDLRTSPESSADAVNGWLSHATGGRLAGLLRPDAIDPSSKMMLASAFYFRGLLEPPLQEMSDKLSFTPTMSTRVEVDGVCGVGQFLFGEMSEPPAKMLEIPYKGGDTALLLLLPDRVAKLKELKAKMSPAFLKTVLGRLSQKTVRVELPKMTIDSHVVLNTHLFKMGVKQAFLDSADFSKLAPGGGVRLSDVVHKAVLVLDQGNVATDDKTTSPTKDMKADAEFLVTRPFLFVLRRPGDDLMLLVGVVKAPQ